MSFYLNDLLTTLEDPQKGVSRRHSNHIFGSHEALTKPSFYALVNVKPPASVSWLCRSGTPLSLNRLDSEQNVCSIDAQRRLGEPRRDTFGVSPKSLRRDAAAAIIRHIAKPNRATTHFTDRDFLAPVTSPLGWRRFCGRLAQNKNYKSMFRSLLKDGGLKSHGLTVCYTGVNVSGSETYTLDHCEPTVILSKRERYFATVGRAGEGFAPVETRPGIPDSFVDNMGDLFGRDGLLMSPSGGRPSRADSAVAAIHLMVRQNGGTLEAFTREDFLRVIEKNWRTLCWPRRQHERWHIKLSHYMKNWTRNDLIDISASPDGYFILQGYKAEGGEITHRGRKEVGIEPKAQSALDDIMAYADSDSSSSKDGSMDAENAPLRREASDVRTPSPTSPLGTTAGEKLGEHSEGAEISNSHVCTGSTDPSIGHFDLAHLEEASNDVHEVAAMKAKDLSKLIAAVMVNYEEGSLARLNELTLCLRIALNNTGVGGGMIANFYC